jgi:hypothetical protein
MKKMCVRFFCKRRNDKSEKRREKFISDQPVFFSTAGTKFKISAGENDSENDSEKNSRNSSQDRHFLVRPVSHFFLRSDIFLFAYQ